MESNKTEVLFATFNPNKLSEVQQLFAGSSIRLLGMNDITLPSDFSDPEETGTTFQENALIKARASAPHYTGWVVAEDSGLEVTALSGEPGVHSKRWVEGTDQDRNQYLLNKLQNTPNRSARFVTVACLLNSQTGDHLFFEGEIIGEIATQELGSDGFGYDPIFIPEGYSETFAQLGNDVKNTLSHRARALLKVKQYLS